MKRTLYRGLIVALLCVSSLRATGEMLTGTVNNATMNKPAADDEIVLIRLGQSMEEIERTKSDRTGSFTFKSFNPNEPHLVRAIHQGVAYHRLAPPGTTSVEVRVYDVAAKVEGIQLTADVFRIQASDGSLQVVRRLAFTNASNPPRSQMNEQNVDFYLPPGAEIDEAMAKSGSGQPVNSMPVRIGNDRYAFRFPLRPGETQFQVTFHFPYTGEMTIPLRPTALTQHLVVMLPKSMQFSADQAGSFQAMEDPEQREVAVHVVQNAGAGQSLSFRVRGMGTLPEINSSVREDNVTNPSPRPGGGLGPPINAPDPLEKFRWYILAAIAVAFTGGAVYISRRSRKGGTLEATVDTRREARPAALSPSAGHSALLEAMKQELFELEMERAQGRISKEDYREAKDALDKTLQRAIQRVGSR